MTKILPEWSDPQRTPFDFIVVGAGAGGAPLAARLAERGYQVLVIEMGPSSPSQPADAAVENTRVPLLHAETTEDPRHSLRYFVKHFDHDPDRSQDPKVHRPDDSDAGQAEDEAGIFYPRAQGVGGCTLHNAMIVCCGPSEDWDEIAESTADPSWRGERMRAYFERIERCHYNRPSTWWARFTAWLGFASGWENARHGQRGWLDTTTADLNLVLNDKGLLRVVLDAAVAAFDAGVEQLTGLLKAAFGGRVFPELDPNNWETLRRSSAGLAQIPCAITPGGERSSARDRLLGLKGAAASRLTILTDVCVTRVLLEQTAAVDGPAKAAAPREPRAAGVECAVQANAYDAAATPARPKSDSPLVPLYCRNEVVLCAGAFNTPQLLMLSGIGPPDDLRAHGVNVQVELDGVGQNLQDRYEVPVIATLTDRFRSLDGLRLTSRQPDGDMDELLKRWRRSEGRPAAERGVYATNGGLFAIFKRSTSEDYAPDLVIFALAGYFPGYHVGWSSPAALAPGGPPGSAAEHKRSLTWLILKARTRNRAGYVRLRSADPFRRPEVNFRSFHDASNDDRLAGQDRDLDALVEGVRFVRAILAAGTDAGAFERIEYPGRSRFDDDDHRWIKHTAWGHHACGTCAIGSVLDERLRVRGVSGLRVADASVFPRIPGYFIVSNVFMVAEKAADMLTEDHPPTSPRPSDACAALQDVPVLPSRREFERRREFPSELEAAEARLIRARRVAAGGLR